MESSCYLLVDEQGKETSLFSGDTLFIGDVGRPDLAQKVIAELTQEKLAAHLYDSLRDKIMPLSDDIIVYPGHGAGSACGKMMSDETTDTLGHQKRSNYALDPSLSKEAFIDSILTGLTPPPGYFPQNVLMNIKGYDQIDEVVEKGTKALSVAAFEAALEESKAIIIDTRPAKEFARGYIPGSYNIGLDGSFANWVGTTIVDVTQPLLIIAKPGKEEEVAIRLARIGFDNALGFLKGGVKAWEKAGKQLFTVKSIRPEKLASLMKKQHTNVLDVRRKSEFNSEHVLHAVNMPLDYYKEQLASIDKNKVYYVHCKSGYRSMVFISILRALGYENLVDIKGGFDAIKKFGKIDVSKFKAPTTML
jgi:rhodanese-related sulfurtransferase